MGKPSQDRKQGFTLIELMITVAIIGILAAVAIPILSGYITESKASEAANVLQGIREKQEAYLSNFKRYTEDLDWAPQAPTDCTQATKDWTSLLPADSPWYELGFSPGGPTYYSYRVTTNFDDEGNIIPGKAPPANKGTVWPANIGPWFLVEGEGDIDCDNKRAHFYISSHNKNVWHQEEALDTMDPTY